MQDPFFGTSYQLVKKSIILPLQWVTLRSEEIHVFVEVTQNSIFPQHFIILYSQNTAKGSHLHVTQWSPCVLKIVFMNHVKKNKEVYIEIGEIDCRRQKDMGKELYLKLIMVYKAFWVTLKLLTNSSKENL